MKIHWFFVMIIIIELNNPSDSSFITVGVLKNRALKFIGMININLSSNDIVENFQELFHSNTKESKEIVKVFHEINDDLVIVKRLRLRYQRKIGIIRVYLDKYWALKYTMKNLYEQFEKIDAAYDLIRDEFIDGQGHRSHDGFDFASRHLEYASLILRYMKHEIESVHFDEKRRTTLPLLITAVMRMHEKDFIICNTGRSNQEYLLAIYLRIMETEIKGIILKAIDKKWQCGDAESLPLEEIRKEFLEEYDLYQKLFAQVVNELSQDFRTCDPAKGWIKGVSYFELERLNQTTLIKATNPFYSCKSYANYMNKNSIRNICSSDVTDSCYHRKDELCEGSLHNCFSAFGFHKCNLTGEARRIKWFRTKEKVYGTPHNRWGYNSSCATTIYNTTSAACLCDCIQYHNKVSLVLTTTDISKNRVIIAVRMRRVRNTMFLQIKDGELSADNEIINPSDVWAPSEPPDEGDAKLSYSLESLNLDNLQLRDYEVLTGVGFQKVPYDPHRRVQLIIQGTEFDWNNGRLSYNSRLLSASITRKYYNFTERNSIYIRKFERLKLVAESPYYVKFVRSRLCRDFGQSTLPLFDSLPIHGDQPLNGIGIFIKSTPNYAGYISLKVFALNFTRYLWETISQYKYDEIMQLRNDNYETICKIIAAIQ